MNGDPIAASRGHRLADDLVEARRHRCAASGGATHGVAPAGYNINVSIKPNDATSVTFVADAPGVFPFYCAEFCSACTWR